MVRLSETVRGMQQLVYIETTIPSFYYTLRADTESVARMNWTRRWWSEFVGHFTPQQEAEIAALREKWAFLLEPPPAAKP